MTNQRYKPVPVDVEATRARWMKRPGFATAYAALADEFAALAELLAARQRAAVPGTSVDTQVRPGRRIPLTNLRKTGVVAGFAVSISGRIRSVRRGSGHVRRRRPTWQDVGGTSMQSSARRTASTT